jgi:hypothetical protein
MNHINRDFSRQWLKGNLVACTAPQQHFFKRMYAKGNYDLSIEEVVDNMEDEKLDWAMEQVENTLRKAGKM